MDYMVYKMSRQSMKLWWSSGRVIHHCTIVPRAILPCKTRILSLQYSHLSPLLRLLCPTALSIRKLSHSALPLKIKTLDDCYRLFCLDEFCTIEELRSAYEITNKRYSGNLQDVKEIHRAYYRILKSWSQTEQSRKTEPQSKYLLTPQPLHNRTYLRYEGVGYEGRSEEQQEESRPKYSNKSPYNAGGRQGMFQGGSNSISVDTMAERLIQQHGGDKQEMIEDLQGFGKPLPDEYEHPYTDPVQAKLNKIMINSDVGTEWMEIRKDFEEELKLAKLRLQSCHDTLKYQPQKTGNTLSWKQAIAEFQDDIKRINGKVENYNFCVPMMSMQRMPFDANKELRKLQEEWAKSRLEERKSAQTDKNSNSNEDVNYHNTGIFEHIKKWLS